MNLDRIVPVFIGIVFTVMLCWVIFVGVIAFMVVDTVNTVGIKGAIESAWCGKSADCRLPEVIDK